MLHNEKHNFVIVLFEATSKDKTTSKISVFKIGTVDKITAVDSAKDGIFVSADEVLILSG
jgi:hypothetical protein